MYVLKHLLKLVVLRISHRYDMVPKQIPWYILSYRPSLKKSECNIPFRLLAEVQARMSKGCRFLLFLHHNYQVSLKNELENMSQSL